MCVRDCRVAFFGSVIILSILSQVTPRPALAQAGSQCADLEARKRALDEREKRIDEDRLSAKKSIEAREAALNNRQSTQDEKYHEIMRREEDVRAMEKNAVNKIRQERESWSAELRNLESERRELEAKASDLKRQYDSDVKCVAAQKLNDDLRAQVEEAQAAIENTARQYRTQLSEQQSIIERLSRQVESATQPSSPADPPRDHVVWCGAGNKPFLGLVIPKGDYSADHTVPVLAGILSNLDERAARPLTVRLHQTICLQLEPVSGKDYRSFIAANPAEAALKDDGMSWAGATLYARWLGDATGSALRLPTWQEWVAAAIHMERHAQQSPQVKYAFPDLVYRRHVSGSDCALDNQLRKSFVIGFEDRQAGNNPRFVRDCATSSIRQANYVFRLVYDNPKWREQP